MLSWIVRDAQRDDALRALLQLSRVREELDGAAHVAHVGGHPGLLPLPQALAAHFERLCDGYTDKIEACFARPLLKDALRLAGFYPLTIHYISDCTRRIGRGGRRVHVKCIIFLGRCTLLWVGKKPE